MMTIHNNNNNYHDASNFILGFLGESDHAKNNEEQIPKILKSVKVFITSINHTPDRSFEDGVRDVVEPQPSYMLKQLKNSFTRKSALDNNDLNGFSKDPINIKVLVRNIFYSMTHFFTGYDLSGKDFKSGFDKLNTELTEWKEVVLAPTMKDISSKINSIFESILELNKFKERCNKKDRILRFTLIATIALTIGGHIVQNKMLKIAGFLMTLGVLFFKTIHYIYMNIKFGVFVNKLQIDVNSTSHSFENLNHKRSVNFDNKNGPKFDFSKSLPDYSKFYQSMSEIKDENKFNREFHSTNFQSNSNTMNNVSQNPFHSTGAGDRNYHSKKGSKRTFYSEKGTSSTHSGVQKSKDFS